MLCGSDITINPTGSTDVLPPVLLICLFLLVTILSSLSRHLSVSFMSPAVLPSACCILLFTVYVFITKVNDDDDKLPAIQVTGIVSGPAAPIENETTFAFIYNSTRGNL